MPFASLKEVLSLPLIVAPMFLISTPKLALAACAEGVMGSFPALNQRTNEGLENWLKEMNDGIQALKLESPHKRIAPYAVNLIVNKTNTRLEADLALLVKYKVPVVITSLGAVSAVVDQIHSYGGIVLHDVTNVEHARKAIQAGVDGLIAVSAGAGGHAGTMNPMPLLKEIRKLHKGILILAGGMTDGHDIRSAQAMGADAAYMGTRFICVSEAEADPAYKQAILNAKSSDIIYTSAVSGIPANFLKESLKAAGYDIDQIRKEGGTADKLKSLESEAVAWKKIWSAGQGVENITDIPTMKELLDQIKKEYQQSL